MKISKTTIGAVIAAAAQSYVSADSISPTSFSDTVNVGGSTTVHKTVTVTAGRPTTSLVDVFFLADTTGSMSGSIANVQASVNDIVSATSGLGSVRYGVGEYKDQPTTDPSSAFAYRLNQDITASTAAIQTGVNMWSAGGGGDTPEANLYGLQQVADTTSWRAGSRRILTWFGDATAHDPSGGATEASATAALVAKGIQVEAIDVGNLNGLGQAARIATATGGHLHSGIASSDVAAQIAAAITSAFDTYSTVALDLSDAPAGVSASASPSSYSGAFDRSVERTFGFDLTFTGVSPGDYTFPTYATVDGGRVATEVDHIVVNAGSPVPDAGSTMMLLGLGVTGLGLIRRKLS